MFAQPDTGTGEDLLRVDSDERVDFTSCKEQSSDNKLLCADVWGSSITAMRPREKATKKYTSGQ